jgi:hypothetical protein
MRDELVEGGVWLVNRSRKFRQRFRRAAPSSPEQAKELASMWKDTLLEYINLFPEDEHLLGLTSRAIVGAEQAGAPAEDIEQLRELKQLLGSAAAADHTEQHMKQMVESAVKRGGVLKQRAKPPTVALG